MNSIIKTHFNHILLSVIILILSLLYLFPLTSIPFHPDESTQIYMSSDVELVFLNLDDVMWRLDKTGDLRQHYRTVDAPLTRTIIGVSRWLSGSPPLPVDWDWSKTWVENKNAGALPSDSSLTVSRFSVALFFPFSLALMYLLGKSIHNRFTGWLALFLFAGNALILLHTRRAMAESPLITFELLSLLILLKTPHHPWLSALPLALALNAKHSNIVLIPLGLAMIGWYFFVNRQKPLWLIKNLAAFILLLSAIHYLLNPYLWQNSYQALQQTLAGRQELVQRQADMLAQVSPAMVLDTCPKRVGNLIYHLYFAQPAIADIGNYLQQTAAAEANYLTAPLTTLFRDPLSASGYLFFTITGFILLTYRVIKPGDAYQRLAGAVLLLGFMAQMGSIILFIPLPFQRYILPLVPFPCIFSALALTSITETIFKRLIRKNKSLP